MPHDGSAAKVLLVDGRAESRDMVANALTIAGFEVAAAPNGASAVTMLEWECPDVIVSSAKVQDMDGYELFTLVRRHPTTLDTPFLLLAGRDRPTALAAAEAGVNMVLTGDVALDVIVARVAELLKDGDGPGAQPDPPDRVRRQAPGRRASLGGHRERRWEARPVPRRGQLAGLARRDGSGRGHPGHRPRRQDGLPGRGILRRRGPMLFQVGRLVHASFSGRTGEDAFAALIQTSQRESQAAFRFNQMGRAELVPLPKTISRSVDQLLMSIAAGIDEGGTSTGPVQPVAVTSQKEG